MPADAMNHGGLGPPEDPEHDLAGALHDVSNVLTLVVAWLDRARAQVGRDEHLREPIEMALARAREGRAIARRAVGAPIGEGHRRTLVDIVRDVAVSVEPALEAKGARLEIDVLGGEVALRAPYAVAQILTNLLLNATAFSPPGGTVRVSGSCTEAEREVCLRVADDGPGVAPEQRSRLFVRGASTRESGAGIGLAYARALALHHEGDVVAEEPPRGASFLVRWRTSPGSDDVSDASPMSDGERFEGPPTIRGSVPDSPSTVRVSSLPEATPSVRAARLLLAGKRVLVVEDDDAVMVLLDTALTVRGAIVISAHSGDELARTLASEPPFDAALIDLSPLAADPLPELAALETHSPHARLVAVSGSIPPPGAPPLVHVRKPFELAEIVEALTAPGRNGP